MLVHGLPRGSDTIFLLNLLSGTKAQQQEQNQEVIRMQSRTALFQNSLPSTDRNQIPEVLGIFMRVRLRPCVMDSYKREVDQVHHQLIFTFKLSGSPAECKIEEVLTQARKKSSEDAQQQPNWVMELQDIQKPSHTGRRDGHQHIRETAAAATMPRYGQTREEAALENSSPHYKVLPYSWSSSALCAEVHWPSCLAQTGREQALGLSFPVADKPGFSSHFPS